MKILAIETSCDETSIAIADFSDSRGSTQKKIKSRIYAEKTPYVRVLSHVVLSQIPLHKKFGGVVPNLAKREHQRNLAPILLQALKESGFSKFSNWKLKTKSWGLKSKIINIEKMLEREPGLFARIRDIVSLEAPPIDAIAVTYGPGLAPALWVGVNFARALSYLWGKPLIPTNHMLGHLYSAILQRNPKSLPRRQAGKVQNSKQIQNKKFPKGVLDFEICALDFPAVALLVSGGHTELVLVEKPRRFKLIGETLDDAAGEAFDKTARILGLGYPGGPEISAAAEMSNQLPATSNRIKLPRPMLNSKDYNFSFSGLKTAVLYLTRDLGPKKTEKLRPLIAKEFQDAVIEVLVKKTLRAAKDNKVKTVLLGGGVAANRLLRKSLKEATKKEVPNSLLLIPDPSLTGDNALIIAAAAYCSGKKKDWRKVKADANVRIS